MTRVVPPTLLVWRPHCAEARQSLRHFANTYEANPLPANLSVPGAVYCTKRRLQRLFRSRVALFPVQPPIIPRGRIDPPLWFGSYGWQGFAGQNSFLEFGKKPFAAGENGGIHGHVVYASTRPFDDPAAAPAIELGTAGSARHGQPLQGGHCRRRGHANSDPGRLPPRPAASTIGRRASGPTRRQP